MRLNVAQRPRSDCVSIAMLEALQRAEFPRVQALLQNDFHDAIATTHPQIMAALEALRVAGATNALLAGSGHVCLRSPGEVARSRSIARSLRCRRMYERFVTRSATTAGVGR